MRKRNYTHVQELFPEIEAMISEGKRREKWQNTLDFGISMV